MYGEEDGQFDIFVSSLGTWRCLERCEWLKSVQKTREPAPSAPVGAASSSAHVNADVDAVGGIWGSDIELESASSQNAPSAHVDADLAADDPFSDADLDADGAPVRADDAPVCVASFPFDIAGRDHQAALAEVQRMRGPTYMKCAGLASYVG